MMSSFVKSTLLLLSFLGDTIVRGAIIGGVIRGERGSVGGVDTVIVGVVDIVIIVDVDTIVIAGGVDIVIVGTNHVIVTVFNYIFDFIENVDKGHKTLIDYARKATKNIKAYTDFWELMDCCLL